MILKSNIVSILVSRSANRIHLTVLNRPCDDDMVAVQTSLAFNENIFVVPFLYPLLLEKNCLLF